MAKKYLYSARFGTIFNHWNHYIPLRYVVFPSIRKVKKIYIYKDLYMYIYKFVTLLIHSLVDRIEYNNILDLEEFEPTILDQNIGQKVLILPWYYFRCHFGHIWYYN